MKLAIVLRLIAVAIAIAGVADPVITRSVAVVEPLTLAIVDTPSLDLPDGGSTRRARAVAIAAALRSALRNEYAVTIHTQSASTDASTCFWADSCVVISDGSAPQRLVSLSAAPTPFLAGIRVGHELSPNVAIARVDAPPTADIFSVASLDVDLRARGAVASTDVHVYDGRTRIGSAKHEWQSTDAVARVRVEWTPLAAGLRRLRAVIDSFAGESTTLDNEAHVAVEVGDRAKEILIVEPQPTWAVTFLRRALERDPRFIVSGRTRPGGPVTLSSGTTMTSAALETTTAAVIVVGAPEALSASDVDALERFVRYRGGSVVIIPNQRVTGPAMRLMPSEVTERRLPEPVVLGQLRAAELLMFDRAGVGMTVIAAADHPVVISQAVGRGRIITSGALDAWRYRGQSHDVFWTSLVADAAAVSPAPLEIKLSPRLLRPGEQADLSVEWNSVRPDIAQADAAATLICGDHTKPVRLWPSGRPGSFHAAIDSDQDGECRIDVALNMPNALTASAMLLFDGGVKHPLTASDNLRHVISVHGGVVADAGQESAIVDALRTRADRSRHRSPTRPMRSVWWILPFASCLGAEWWLRRRQGLR